MSAPRHSGRGSRSWPSLRRRPAPAPRTPVVLGFAKRTIATHLNLEFQADEVLKVSHSVFPNAIFAAGLEIYRILYRRRHCAGLSRRSGITDRHRQFTSPESDGVAGRYLMVFAGAKNQKVNHVLSFIITAGAHFRYLRVFRKSSRNKENGLGEFSAGRSSRLVDITLPKKYERLMPQIQLIQWVQGS